MLELQTCRLDQWRSQLALDVRLKRLLDTIPLEVQTDGISLEALLKMLRGKKRARMPLRGYWRRASSNGLA